MGIIVYRELEAEECGRLKEINPSQFIGKAWREIDGRRQLIDIDYQEFTWPNGYENHLNGLKKTILDGGFAVGAFDSNDKLIGFATLNREFFGEKFNHVLLDQLFISLEYRNKGIGRSLFMLCADMAKEWNADKIYICAGSAEETIAFYYAIGCSEAKEVNKTLYEKDVKDIQLEYLLHRNLILLRPTPEYASEIAEYRQEFLDVGDSMDGCGSLRQMADPAEWLQQVKDLSKQKTVPENWVISTQFICVRETDHRIVGMIQIRHYFNDFLEKYAGHIGYSVRPSERRKGYATHMLKNCLPYCKSIGLGKVMVSCHDTNEASRKTILANGGVYESTVFEPEESINMERYWIAID
jgi:predicted acetyltransferase